MPSGRPQGGQLEGSALVDRWDRRVRYLRVSVLDRCNYRCTYCMPDGAGEYGPREDLLSLEEVEAVVETFARWGVERVRLTGGEPTLRPGLVDLVGRLSALRVGTAADQVAPMAGSAGEREGTEPKPGAAQRLTVAMTTNGERLESLAVPLRRAGLQGLTVSLDSLDPQRFAHITRRGSLERVRSGLEAACRAEFPHLKLNTVAIRGFNDAELGDVARFAWDRGMIPRFIEQMPMSAGALFVPGTMMTAAEVRDSVAASVGAPLEPEESGGVQGYGPASYWRVVGGPWAGHRFGTIGALSENFCASCNRLRVSATGQLHGCLARDDTADLRSALRGGRHNELERAVRCVLATKREAHSFGPGGEGGPQKAMMSIGG